MTLTAQVEPYSATLHELLPHYAAHWAELALDRDKPQAALKPQYDIYKARDAAGQLVLVTLRDTGVLVGYFLVFIVPCLHYADCLTATMDIIYVTPPARGRFGGVRLIRTMRRELQRRGINRWFVGEKIGKSSGLGRIFELMGFKPVETYYSLWIGN